MKTVKTAKVKSDAKSSEESKLIFTAFNLKTKEKGCPILDPVVSRTKRGGYIVKGHDGKKNILSAIVNESRALEGLKVGILQKDGVW